jgi:hypothetical protein
MADVVQQTSDRASRRGLLVTIFNGHLILWSLLLVARIRYFRAVCEVVVLHVQIHHANLNLHTLLGEGACDLRSLDPGLIPCCPRMRRDQRLVAERKADPIYKTVHDKTP